MGGMPQPLEKYKFKNLTIAKYGMPRYLYLPVKKKAEAQPTLRPLKLNARLEGTAPDDRYIRS